MRGMAKDLLTLFFNSAYHIEWEVKEWRSSVVTSYRYIRLCSCIFVIQNKVLIKGDSIETLKFCESLYIYIEYMTAYLFKTT